MDIVDIDEALNNDCFCLMEEKNQDDVLNILQQWKCNMQKGMKCDTRTFVRPKRKFNQNSVETIPADLSMNAPVNMQIGGIVTNASKHPFQDMPPPSTDLSVEFMNNSLINSADFSNVSFFKTTHSEDLLVEKQCEFMPRKVSDHMEELSSSGESNLMKDKNIDHIDDNLCEIVNCSANCISSSTKINSYNYGEEVRKTNADSELCPSNISLFKISELDSMATSYENLNITNIDLEIADGKTILNNTYETGEKERNITAINETFINSNSADEINIFFKDQHLSFSPSKEQTVTVDSTTQECETYDDFKIRHHNVHLLQSTPYKWKSVNKLNEESIWSPMSNGECTFSPMTSCGKKVINKCNSNNLTKISKVQFTSSTANNELCVKQNKIDFDKILKNFQRIALTEDQKKIRQSIDNIKKRHSDSIVVEDIKSLKIKTSLLNSSERLLSKRDRLYEYNMSLNSEDKIISCDRKQTNCYSDKPLDKNISESTDVQNENKLRTMRIIKNPNNLTVTQSEETISQCYANEKNAVNTCSEINKYTKHEIINEPKIYSAHKSRARQRGKYISEIAGVYNKNNTINNEASKNSSHLGVSDCILGTNLNAIKEEKRPLPVKAKSYQNLSSQYGFSKSSEQRQITSSSKLEEVSSKQIINKGGENSFLLPVATADTGHRKSGLMRPSSGLYSSKKIECEADNSQNPSSNSLSSFKGNITELRKQILYEQHHDSTEKLPNYAAVRTKKFSNIKSNIPKPCGLANPAPKKSVIPLPLKNKSNR